jgi:hypothetical protein
MCRSMARFAAQTAAAAAPAATVASNANAQLPGPGRRGSARRKKASSQRMRRTT